jgi:hypothetical protein
MDARKLVGMTQGARRRRLWDAFFDEAWDGATINNFRTEAAKYRLGQRLRPCPGCDKCTDSPHSLVLGWTRRIGGHAKLTRIFSRWYKRAEYLLMIYRPGPTWNPAAGGGLTKAEAWKNMADCLREHDQLKVLCDGSGVLPANGKVHIRRECRKR